MLGGKSQFVHLLSQNLYYSSIWISEVKYIFTSSTMKPESAWRIGIGSRISIGPTTNNNCNAYHHSFLLLLKISAYKCMYNSTFLESKFQLLWWWIFIKSSFLIRGLSLRKLNFLRTHAFMIYFYRLKHICLPKVTWMHWFILLLCELVCR